MEVAFEEGAGVLEVLFGVGFGGGDAVKRFVEDADDALLFGNRRNWYWIIFDKLLGNSLLTDCPAHSGRAFTSEIGTGKVVVEKLFI